MILHIAPTPHLTIADNSVNPLFVKHIAATGLARGSLVLLHGWGFDHRCWQSLQPFLQKDYDVHLVDLPAFGASPALDVTSAEAWLAQTLVLLEEYIGKIGGPVSLIGWSLGGQFALRLALRNSYVKRVVGVATNLQFCANATWTTAMNEATFQQFQESFFASPEKTLKEFSRLVAAGSEDFLALRRLLPKLVADFQVPLKFNWGFALEALQLLDHTQAFFKLPVKLLLFDADALVPISLFDALSRYETIVGQRFALAGHGYLLSQPEAVAASILGFIDEQ